VREREAGRGVAPRYASAGPSVDEPDTAIEDAERLVDEAMEARGYPVGDDFDRRLVDYLADEFQRGNGVDLRKDPQALQRLFEAAEKAKVELSSVTQTQVNLPFITADANGPKHLVTTIMRSTFEEVTHDLVERCLGPVEHAMTDAKVTAAEFQQPFARMVRHMDRNQDGVIDRGDFQRDFQHRGPMQPMQPPTAPQGPGENNG